MNSLFVLSKITLRFLYLKGYNPGTRGEKQLLADNQKGQEQKKRNQKRHGVQKNYNPCSL